MSDFADPHAGWHVSDVLKTGHRCGIPKSDTYGALAAHILHVLKRFCSQVRTRKMMFQLYCLDARELPTIIHPSKFDRIELANLTDAPWLGVRNVLILYAPLLRPKDDNRHGAIIGLFLHVFRDERREGERVPRKGMMQLIHRLLGDPHFHQQFGTGTDFTIFDARFLSATEIFMDYDSLFNRYSKRHSLLSVTKDLGTCMRQTQTIIDPWPCRFKSESWSEAAQIDFDNLMMSGHSGGERYVEWELL